MTTFVPPAKPRLSAHELEVLLSPFAIDRVKYPLIIVGIRGYYRDTMGKPGVNDRNIYDDAIFLYSANVMAAFNANTDPSKSHPGMASLKPGFYPCYRFDLHHGKVKTYPAICQREGPVTVIRDGNPPREDTGMFGVNIHCGGYWTTSSEGCQTIPPEQWPSFYALAREQMQRLGGEGWEKAIIPYVLIDPQQKGVHT
jgi:hypothetical protein